ncbi:MAG TPA: LysE family transporter [Syntrophomonadaceae bacterium]|nr:LysE family transporter [Syntrophomonadaceae bacterium]
MTLAALFGTAFVVGLTGAMMPGPMLSTTIAQSARRGWTAGPLMVLGHGTLELVLVMALMAGLANYLTLPTVSTVISLLGGAFLLYLGYSMSRQAAAGRILLYSSDGSGPESQGLHPVLAGVLISLSNPFWTLWWATVGLTYLTLALQGGPVGLGAFFSGHIMADLLWFGLVAGLVASGRRILNQQMYNFILLACGLFLLAMGGYFMYHGFMMERLVGVELISIETFLDI